ncbi:hypothetical protein PFF91_06270 [Burkholderia cenocepacia]|uniref:hypothetical protein n=1 Tax=Burkholderia cenocepacia TaxID=95486 RepID=UPI001B965A65|nr:hypothetical protein [Burkholderia cenocepacia]MBR8096721.1 hypothetical protein [Burkholderia cenocepacia]MDA3665592.1 hypothetical protein [Burkholderia cenocepacia]MDA3678018.1 hypothetical protein [Burkholderia cenocepacia]MDA3682652.1 hypothetical protein [Burkholderia cenocepacia]MDA3690591.1 hypothetical protein [Burkholderia cenocepacia]
MSKAAQLVAKVEAAHEELAGELATMKLARDQEIDRETFLTLMANTTKLAAQTVELAKGFEEAARVIQKLTEAAKKVQKGE